MTVRDFLDRSLYSAYEDLWDVKLFRNEVISSLRPGVRVLDVGAGRGALKELSFRGMGAEIWGVDVDPAVLTNPNLDKAFVTSASALTGVENQSIDVVISCNVLEHVSDPKALLGEIRRVLKPGGVFLAKTPNKFHYMPLVASLTPIWFHRLYNRWRGREEVDTFPTRYLLNSRRAVARMAESVGLEVDRLWTVEGRPEYLRLTPPTYLIGWIYERLVNVLRLTDLRGVLFIHLHAPRGSPP